MKKNTKTELEQINELESAYKIIEGKEAKLKKDFQHNGNGASHYQTLSDIRESEERYRRLFETAQDGILVLDAETGAITDANPYITNSLGYSFTELFGKRLWEIGAFVDVKDSKAAFEQLQKNEYIRYKDLPLKTKDGQNREVEFISNVYLVNGKKIIQCNIRDITERRTEEQAMIKADDALRESEERFFNAFENAPTGMALVSTEGHWLKANRSLCNLLGYSEKEFLTRTIQDLTYSEDINISLENLRRANAGEKRSHQLEKRYVHKDGHIITALLNISLVHNDQGKPLYFVSHIYDITERKQVENALRESNEKFHQLADNISDVFWIRSPDLSEVQYISPAFEKIWGRSVESLYAQPHEWVNFIHPDDRERVSKSFDALTERKSTLNIEYRITRPDGKIRWVHVRGFQIRTVSDQIIRHIGIVSDITDRRQTEELLRTSEEKFRTVIETLPDGFYRSTVNGRFVDVNMSMVKMLGYDTKEELLHIYIPTDLYFQQEDRTSMQYNQEFTGNIEIYQLKKKDGTGIWVEDRCHYLRDEFGEIKYHEGISRDITERRMAEEQLKKSEEKYRNIFENVQDVFFETTIEGTINEVSPSISIVTKGQYHSSDLIGKSIYSFFSDDEEAKKLLSLLEQQESVTDYEVTLLNLDGSLIAFSVSAKIQYNVQGEPEKVVGSLRDITERKETFEASRKAEERYRRLVEFSPTAIMVHSYGKIVFVNPAAVKLLAAHDTSDLIGKPILDILHKDHRESAQLRQLIGENENEVLPTTNEKFLRLDGVTIDVEVVSLKIEYDGKPAMQDVIRDVTEQQKLQQQVLQSQKNESIGTLAGGIAHDFNNILAIIVGYTYIIEKRGSDTKTLSDSIAAINQAIKRGAALVKQILTFARKTEILFEPISIADLIQELVSMLRQTFPKIITFRNNFPTDIPFIFADRTQMHQALLNLCVNARDAMPNGGSISLDAEQIPGVLVNKEFPSADQLAYICISVSDTGEGMSETTRNKIFDPFFTTKPQGKGTGLGLSVVYGVVQAHHGFIAVESEIGKGTTFRLYFPVPNDVVKSIESPNIVSFDDGGTETILLVEDEMLLLDMVRLLLESKGYTIFVAHDGAEAVEMYNQHQKEIDLVVTDLGLPVMTGLEEYKKLKEINPNITVIFASGFIDPDVNTELLAAGAKHFLQKPYVANDMLMTIREALR